MAYELHVNAGVAGREQLEQLTRATESQAGKTKQLNDALYGLTGATQKQTEAQLKYATQLSKTEEWTLRYKTAQLDANRATDAGTQSITRLGNAHGQSVSQIQAVGGALRVLEGAMPIRAAERFLTMIPGIGSALQVAFPVFGAIAFEQVMDRMIKKGGELYNAWSPIVAAQKESLRLMEESDRKYESLIEKANQLRLDTYERQYGRSARLRLESTEMAGNAKYEDAGRISYLQSLIANQQRIASIQPGSIAARNPGERSRGDLAFAREHGLATDPAAAQERLRGLQAQLEEAQLQQKVDQLHAKDLQAKANEADTKVSARETRADSRERTRDLKERAKEWAEIHKEIEKAAAGLEKFSRMELKLPDSTVTARRTNKETEQGLRDLGLGDLLGVHSVERPAPPGPSGQQMLRDAQQRGRRSLALYSSQAQYAGASPQAQVAGEYQLRIQLAQQEYEAQVRIAQEKHDAQAQENALDELVEKRYDASLEAEQKMLELAIRQKQQFEQGAIGLLNAAASGHAGSYIAGKAKELGEQMLMKLVLGPVFDKIAAAGRQKTVSVADVIGDAAKQATDQNTVATDDNTRALRDLTEALRAVALSPSGGGGSAGGGISFPSGSGGPGVFGNAGFGGASSIPGLGGIGGGASGIASQGSAVGKAIGVAAGGFGVYHGISDVLKGGARSAIGGAGEIAAGAGAVIAALAPALAMAGPIGMVAGIGLGLVSSLFGDPKAARASQIGDRLKNNQFMAPVAINASMSTGGTYSDFDRYGNVRTSNLSPFPTVEQGFFDYRHNQVIPGRTISPFGGPGGPPAPIVNITAIDTKSILDRHADIADAVARSLNLGSSGHLAETLTARGN